MLRDHEEPHGHHVVILPLVVGAGSISVPKLAFKCQFSKPIETAIFGYN